MELIIVACMGETAYLTPESAERGNGFDNNTDACSWDNAGHKIG
jgi:hypothetical protein